MGPENDVRYREVPAASVCCREVSATENVYFIEVSLESIARNVLKISTKENKLA